MQINMHHACMYMHVWLCQTVAAAKGEGSSLQSDCCPFGAIRLLSQFVAESIKNGREEKDFTSWSTDDPMEMRKRFKMIGFLDNADEMSSVLGSMTTGLINKFNGKPVICYKSGAAALAPSPTTVVLANGAEATYEDYMEFTVKVQNFAYLATSNIPAVLSKVSAMLLSVGFVIQADDDEEQLPENLLGCAQFHRIDIQKALPFRHN